MLPKATQLHLDENTYVQAEGLSKIDISPCIFAELDVVCPPISEANIKTEKFAITFSIAIVISRRFVRKFFSFAASNLLSSFS